MGLFGGSDPFSWQGSQDIVDPLELMHESTRSQQAREYQEGMDSRAIGLQEDWFQYIKDQYAPYSEVATQALSQQAGLAGLDSPEMKAQMISQIENDPFYQAKVKAGDDAVLRGASMTGGLRSGNSSSALALQNQAMLSREIEDRYQKLAGLSGQGFMGQQAESQYGTSALGGLTGAMGAASSGSIAREAARQDKTTGAMGLVGGIFSAFSDERLKTEIVKTGEKHGLPWYSWTWNEKAGALFNLHGESEGHMAHEVESKYPDLVGEFEGYKTVNYGGMA